MQDKNGAKIVTGNIVEITGAYFNNDNGLWLVTNSPGDPTWSGDDLSLLKVSKKGKISTSKYRVGFWPIKSFINDRYKRHLAKQWNDEHAQIEIRADIDLSYAISYFQGIAADLQECLRYRERRFDKDSAVIKEVRIEIMFYEAIIERLNQEKDGALN